MSRGIDKSLWDLAIEEHEINELQHGKDEEASVLFVGSKGSGKTSMILRFLDRDETPKSTIALEYTFGRRAKGANMVKDVGHMWELGGGTWLSKLIDIPINVDTINKMAVVIVLDLSKPNELWFTLDKLLQAVKTRVESVVAEAQVNNQRIKEELKTAALERLGNEHPDIKMIDPFLIPLVIVGGKYDVFQDFDSEKKKIISKTLRFVAHMYGAHLMFFSAKDNTLLNKARAMISHLLFDTPGPKTAQFEHNKPIMVPAGQDHLEQIGSPMLPEGDLGSVTAKTPIDLWKQAYIGFFPQENVSDPSLIEDPAKDPQYAEPAIDSMRAQKDQELERYRRLSERRMKEARQKAMEVGY